MVPDNYQPQTESLTHLQTKLEQLQTILDKNNSSKTRIFDTIDEITRSVRPAQAESDIKEVIKHIKNFINTQARDMSVDESQNNNNNAPELTELQELRLQNVKLRYIYQQRQLYYEEIIKENEEFEKTINYLLEKLKSIKDEENVNKIKETRLKALKLQQLEKEEFDLFDTLLSVDQVNNKLIRIISELIEITNKDVDTDPALISVYQLLHQLQFYKARIEKQVDKAYYIEDFDKLALDQIKS